MSKLETSQKQVDEIIELLNGIYNIDILKDLFREYTKHDTLESLMEMLGAFKTEFENIKGSVELNYPNVNLDSQFIGTKSLNAFVNNMRGLLPSGTLEVDINDKSVDEVISKLDAKKTEFMMSLNGIDERIKKLVRKIIDMNKFIGYEFLDTDFVIVEVGGSPYLSKLGELQPRIQEINNLKDKLARIKHYLTRFSQKNDPLEILNIILNSYVKQAHEVTKDISKIKTIDNLYADLESYVNIENVNKILNDISVEYKVFCEFILKERENVSKHSISPSDSKSRDTLNGLLNTIQNTSLSDFNHILASAYYEPKGLLHTIRLAGDVRYKKVVKGAGAHIQKIINLMKKRDRIAELEALKAKFLPLYNLLRTNLFNIRNALEELKVIIPIDNIFVIYDNLRAFEASVATDLNTKEQQLGPLRDELDLLRPKPPSTLR